ncbi:MAG: phage tail protein [Chloroflexota bacterium]|jgi:phage tail-like protein
MPADPYISGRDDALTEDPLLGFNFKLDISGQLAGFFTECSGVGSENEVVEHKVVDNNGHEVIRKIPGRLKWQDVSLKRGMTSDLQIWQWRETVVKGKMGDARKNITITMLDREYNDVAKWSFINAWPSKVTGPSLKSDDNNFGIEEVTIVHEGMSRDQ